MIQALPSAPEGQLVAAALDGDGDRCLLVQATKTGFAVVDGDAMAAMLLEAAADQPWSFAASIESDVALFGHASNPEPRYDVHGDRRRRPMAVLRPSTRGRRLVTRFDAADLLWYRGFGARGASRTASVRPRHMEFGRRRCRHVVRRSSRRRQPAWSGV